MAGGALTGVVVAFLQIPERAKTFLEETLNQGPRLVRAMGQGGYDGLGVLFFAALAAFLAWAARRPSPQAPVEPGRG